MRNSIVELWPRTSIFKSITLIDLTSIDVTQGQHAKVENDKSDQTILKSRNRLELDNNLLKYTTISLSFISCSVDTNVGN